MAIAFGAVSAKTDATGSSTVAANYPTGVAAGHLALGIRNMMSGVNTVTFLDEAGWAELADFVGGTGNVADAHNSRLRVGSKVLTGSESGSVTFDASGNNSSMAMMARYSNGTGVWNVVSTNGDDATHGANRAVTGGAALALAPGDVVVVVVSVDTDAALTITAPTITASGITFGTVTRRTSGAGSTAGLDGNIEIFDATVTAGTATVAPSFSMTTATSQCGPVALIRLREVSASPATGAGSGSVLFSGGFTGGRASKGSGSGGLALAGGTVTGQRASKGSGSGTLARTGSAAGARSSKGGGSGAFALTGSATGARASRGAGSGLIGLVASLIGGRPSAGSGQGAVAFGSSTFDGRRASQFVGDGELELTGEAEGARASSGAGDGEIELTGEAETSRPSSGGFEGTVEATATTEVGRESQGTFTGTLARTASAIGQRISAGIFGGSLDWLGTTSGDAPVEGEARGTFTGALDWAGAFTGRRRSSGAAQGDVALTGDATGGRSSSGGFSGFVARTGAADGRRRSAAAFTGVLDWLGEFVGGLPLPEVVYRFLGFIEREISATMDPLGLEASFVEHEVRATFTGDLMQLPRHDRRYYDPGPSLEPAVDPGDWEVSFNGGQTWLAPREVADERPRWLIAGPLASEPETTDFQASSVVTEPKVRVEVGDQYLTFDAPPINLVD